MGAGGEGTEVALVVLWSVIPLRISQLQALRKRADRTPIAQSPTEWSAAAQQSRTVRKRHLCVSAASVPYPGG